MATRRKKTDKASLKAELLAGLEKTLAALEAAHADTTAGATHSDSRQENDKDTRAIELTYLARGQAMRVEDLRRAVLAVKTLPVTPLDVVAAGALVTADEDDTQHLFYVAPEGGGTKLADGTVSVVTPRSPLGDALVGKREGDDCELPLGGRKRELVITSIE